MAIAVVIDFAGGTAEKHDALVAEMGLTGETASTVQGLIFHAAGPTEGGWRVIDVWESEEAFQRFGAVIGPILQDVGMSGEPQLFPLHNFVK